jgi:hypothetical protein
MGAIFMGSGLRKLEAGATCKQRDHQRVERDALLGGLLGEEVVKCQGHSDRDRTACHISRGTVPYP